MGSLRVTGANETQGTLTTGFEKKAAPKTPFRTGTVEQRLEENAKSGASWGQPYGRIDGRTLYCSMEFSM